MSSHSRAQGVLIGQVIGDNLGAQVESSSASTIASRFPDGVKDLADGGHFNVVAGQPTGSTELALALTRSILRNSGYDIDDVLDSYNRWVGSQPFDIEGAARKALINKDPDAGSESAGALARVSPLAIYLTAFPTRTADELSRLDAALTHPGKLCQDINSTFVSVLAMAIYKMWDRDEMVQAFIEYSKNDVKTLVETALSKPPEDYEHSESPVRTAFANAIYELANGDSFEESLVRTVGRGGDTSANAAVAGALLGGLYGVEGIPKLWTDAVVACRPGEGTPTPRPQEYWPTDTPALALGLVDIAGL